MAAKLEVKLNKILVIAVIARPINMNILPGFCRQCIRLSAGQYRISKRKASNEP